MKHLRKSLLSLVMLIPFVFSSCSKDDVPAVTVVNSKVYDLGAVGTSGISGTATFIEKSDATVSIELDLKNTPQGGIHPAHIHLNTAAEGGDIALTLTAVDGSTGKSTTTFKTLKDGSAINYQALINFDGYINVHESANNLGTLVAQGDIGQNALTGRKMSYVLAPKAVPSISGTVELAERNNGTTLVTIKLVGTGDPAGESHPAHIHDNMSGDVIAALEDVNGDTGISKSQVANLVGGAPVTYTQLLALNAYVNVHLSLNAMGTIVAQGNIGSNVAGAESKTYSVINSGTSAYIFNGEGLTNVSNPNFTFKRGGTYKFNLAVGNHPFYIKSVQSVGTANSYNSGVTNNGAITGTITFTVPMDAPPKLFYICEFHPDMTGMIAITD
jgi:hypothetical protein